MTLKQLYEAYDAWWSDTLISVTTIVRETTPYIGGIFTVSDAIILYGQCRVYQFDYDHVTIYI